MKFGFHFKLAIDSIRKNKRLYLPYILTSSGMTAMYYIMSSLCYGNALSNIRGAEEVHTMLVFGTWVVAIFAAIFLFYTNSFLMHRRKKEFGLYNILGMGKPDIIRIMFSETLVITAISLVCGILSGIAFSKLAELGLLNLIDSDITYSINISLRAVLYTVFLFICIFAVLFISAVIQLKNTNAIELLHSENMGEKAPKANYFLGFTGLLILGAAYYLAVTITDPIAAMLWFFVAVIMVIVGTYMIFISASVMFCRLLQKRKKYYYHPRHFVSVASMVYRMKRNGAGLASVCILATMVLVTISSTSALYLGNEKQILATYPYDIDLYVNFDNAENMTDSQRDEIIGVIDDTYEKFTSEDKQLKTYRSLYGAVYINDEQILIDSDHANSSSRISQIYIITANDYNSVSGENVSVDSDNALLYSTDVSYDPIKIEFPDAGIKLNIIDHAEKIPELKMNFGMNSIVLVVSDLDVLCKLNKVTTIDGNPFLKSELRISFDTALNPDRHADLFFELQEKLDKYIELVDYDTGTMHFYRSSCRQEARQSFMNNYGSLFFLGIILSVAFIFATVLIIYYKQISEGYEDAARFEIMQKVGMTKKEIRQSINSQLLTVFFLPLLCAGLHLLFAFPMIKQILNLFNQINNTTLYTITTLVSFALFSLLYVFVYRLTSNAYYNIVSGKKDRR